MVTVKIESIERTYYKIILLKNVNFCKDHHDKTEIPDPLVEDLISFKLNNPSLCYIKSFENSMTFPGPLS